MQALATSVSDEGAVLPVAESPLRGRFALTSLAIAAVALIAACRGPGGSVAPDTSLEDPLTLCLIDANGDGVIDSSDPEEARVMPLSECLEIGGSAGGLKPSGE